MDATLPTRDDVLAAAERIAPHVHRTPVHTSRTLDAELGAAVFFKCENFQKVGAFKARGATNAVLRLPPQAPGVIAHSSGNHAAALAFAAAIRGIPCTVVMPEGAPAVKVAAVRGYGAEVVFCRQSEREEVCAREAAARGARIVHPYENHDVIAGQGSAAVELLEQVEGLDWIVAPVGGGGLLAGTALAACDAPTPVAVRGAEPAAVDDAHRSLERGALERAPQDPRTLADGLLTGLGRPNFAILSARGIRVTTVGEGAIAAAARFFLERMKLVVEPSGATALAALRADRSLFRGARVGVVVSGGNTDFSWLRDPPSDRA